ncbi:tRNA (adenine(22)-N(1))-methyltransferase TrmK, partial [Streptococcus pyogenes]
NGLAAIEKDDQIDTITIAGMGGRLIADILAADLDKLSNIKRLVLQPNNREDELRDWLSDHGFRIVAEEILTENKKFYEILV